MCIQKIKMVLAGTIFVFGVLFFMGKTSLILNPLSRKIYLETYIAKLRTSKSIEAADFWEFRDFYSPGSSSFSADAVVRNEPFLTFDTPVIQSRDYLVARGSLPPNMSAVPLGAEVVIQTDKELVYRSDNKLVMRFIKSIDEMKKVNGFFSHFRIDIEKYNDRQWYNETTVINEIP